MMRSSSLWSSLSPEPIKSSEIKLSTVSSVSFSKPLLRLRGLPAWWVDLHGSFWVTLVLHQSDEADGLCRSQRSQSIPSTYSLSHSPLHDCSLFVFTLSQGHYQRLYIFSVIIISSGISRDLVLYAHISRKIYKHMWVSYSSSWSFLQIVCGFSLIQISVTWGKSRIRQSLSLCENWEKQRVSWLWGLIHTLMGTFKNTFFFLASG